MNETEPEDIARAWTLQLLRCIERTITFHNLPKGWYKPFRLFTCDKSYTLPEKDLKEINEERKIKVWKHYRASMMKHLQEGTPLVVPMQGMNMKPSSVSLPTKSMRYLYGTTVTAKQSTKCWER